MSDVLNRAAPIAAQLDQTTERELVCRENAEFTEWWNRVQACPEHNLITENAAHAAWQERARRATPTAAQLDANAMPPPDVPEVDDGHDYGPATYSVELVKQIVAPYAERIRHLERELAERRPRVKLDPELKAALKEAAKTRSTVALLPDGEPVFINYGDQPEDTADLCCTACGGSGHIDDQRQIADIDGRTAGTAPSDELRKAVNAHCNDLLDCAAILYDDGRFKATAVEIRAAVAELKSALAAAPSLSGTEEGNEN